MGFLATVLLQPDIQWKQMPSTKWSLKQTAAENLLTNKQERISSHS